MKANHEICAVFDEIADWFDQNRGKTRAEIPYLQTLLKAAKPNPSVLDLGCGPGGPVAQFMAENNLKLTGIDGAPRMIELARAHFPKMEWRLDDMRTLRLGRTFDAVIAWHSLFNLTRDEQRAMFDVFRAHTAPGGVLLFTAGFIDCEMDGQMNGHTLTHASLNPAEYNELLLARGFEVIMHEVCDYNVGGHAVWMAKLNA